ncbi:hypothetical protein LOAG_13758 [Loa loa]|uniref:Uncharacterized protein n=2 Tax=Loa loa TaxID=7209 RepID=A0A1S0TJD3_LOALO|nr:hypothetical protein LOAG_13758 [Loa loa]EFO14757.1 hypothetical protein LOAG_13758 [Loa loa]
MMMMMIMKMMMMMIMIMMSRWTLLSKLDMVDNGRCPRMNRVVESWEASNKLWKRKKKLMSFVNVLTGYFAMQIIFREKGERGEGRGQGIGGWGNLLDEVKKGGGRGGEKGEEKDDKKVSKEKKEEIE